MRKWKQLKIEENKAIGINYEITWKEYLDGVYQIEEDALTGEIIAPFYIAIM